MKLLKNRLDESSNKKKYMLKNLRIGIFILLILLLGYIFYSLYNKSDLNSNNRDTHYSTFEYENKEIWGHLTVDLNTKSQYLNWYLIVDAVSNKARTKFKSNPLYYRVFIKRTDVNYYTWTSACKKVDFYTTVNGKKYLQDEGVSRNYRTTAIVYKDSKCSSSYFKLYWDEKFKTLKDYASMGVSASSTYKDFNYSVSAPGRTAMYSIKAYKNNNYIQSTGCRTVPQNGASKHYKYSGKVKKGDKIRYDFTLYRGTSCGNSLNIAKVIKKTYTVK